MVPVLMLGIVSIWKSLKKAVGMICFRCVREGVKFYCNMEMYSFKVIEMLGNVASDITLP